LVLGEEVDLSQVVHMENQTLVGRASGRTFALKTMVDWMHNAWKEHLGYVPEIVELNRNWFAFTFLQPEHSKWALGKPWSVNNSPLLLKPWSPLFDANKERMDIIPVWVRLPTLPLHFWSFEHFKLIGNYLGDFLDADMTFEETKQRKVARVLVNLNIREGLGEEVDLSWGSFTHTQRLDYENVPFRCRRCHQYRHLIKNCSMPVRTRGMVFKSDKGQLQKVNTPTASSSEGIQNQEEQGRWSESFTGGSDTGPSDIHT
jgi:hypothetical protein